MYRSNRGRETLSQPGHILLVEDNPGDVRLFEEVIAESDLEAILHVVSTEEEALEFIDRRDEDADVPEPDAVLIDWYLANDTADVVLSALRRTYPAVPVLVICGTNAPPAVLELDSVGTDDYMTKPSDPNGYHELLTHCVDLAKQP